MEKWLYVYGNRGIYVAYMIPFQFVFIYFFSMSYSDSLPASPSALLFTKQKKTGADSSIGIVKYAEAFISSWGRAGENTPRQRGRGKRSWGKKPNIENA